MVVVMAEAADEVEAAVEAKHDNNVDGDGIFLIRATHLFLRIELIYMALVLALQQSIKGLQ